MIVTHKLSMNLESMEQEQHIQLVQNDSNSRVLELSLYENGAAWLIPLGTTVTMRYLKPDGSSGEYDTLADGTSAWSWADNRVTVRLLSQLTSQTGVVHCTLMLQQGGRILHSFPVQLLVQPDLTGVAIASSGGGGTICLLQGLYAQVGQVLQVASVNGIGSVTALRAVPLQQMTGSGLEFDGGYTDSDGYLHLTKCGTELEASAFTPFLVGSGSSGGGLPLPPTATVGQSIVVSAVDENGVVTATQAVDAQVLPSAEEVGF